MKNQTSLELFKNIVNTQYPSIKKYIVSENEHHIVIEDPMGDFVIGSNKELCALFEDTNTFPIKKISVSYKEKDSVFIINIDLK